MTDPEQTGEGQLVGVSVSDPDERDLTARGLAQFHVRHLFVELARHLLAGGYSLAYGVDFRQQGYTEAMLDLVRTYNRSERPDSERIRIYSAWPSWTDLTTRDRAEIRGIATLIQAEPPSGAPSELPLAVERTPGERLWAALAFTEMRRLMNRDVHARVVLGGRVFGQAGLFPGVVEEALLAIETGVPLFLLGGFGGAASAVARGLRGETPQELTLDFQLSHTDGYAELRTAAAEDSSVSSLEALNERLRNTEMGDLANGLTREENTTLMDSDDVDTLVSLVVRGLRRV